MIAMLKILALALMLQLPPFIPKDKPEKTEIEYGMLMKVNKKSIVIDEASYALSPNVQVTDVDGNVIKIEELKPPCYVKMAVTPKRVKPVVIRIQVLQQFRINPYTGRVELVKSSRKFKEELK